MALNKVDIPVASGPKHEFDLSCDHQTSMNFLLAQPIYYRHVPRGEHFTDSTLGVIRPVSVAVPTYGRVRNNIRAFFVPYRLVFPQYDACRADVLGFSYDAANIPVNVPRFSLQTLMNYFREVILIPDGRLVETVESSDNYDFVYNGDYYKFTAAGRRRVKLLRSLGYEFIPSAKKDFYYDALALLAYAQIYLDWYANSQYLDSYNVVEIRKILCYNDPTHPLELSWAQLNALLSLVFAVVYDTDEYFNAAWDVPFSPTATQFTSPTNVVDLDGTGVVSVGTSPNGTPVMVQSSADNTSIGSQYIHDMLQALTNYQRRHALSGAREIDRALADYGFVSDYASLKRAVYIGNRTFDIKFGDVYQTVNNSDDPDVSNLGNFAGRAFGNGEGTFDFTASEDGIIIIVSTIIPSCGIVQGYDRNNRHLNKYDFYDPNFEVGVQVLEKGEVYVSQDESFYQGQSVDTLTEKFGYTGRFGEYKRPRSWWTSENRFRSVDQGGDSWNLFRLFDDSNFGGSIDNLVHSLNFTRAIDWEQFNRIFNYTGSDRDKFECFYHHEVHCQSPMKPLFETYDFKELGKSIKLDINGSKLN